MYFRSLMKRNDYIILASIILSALILIAVLYFQEGNEKGSVLVITREDSTESYKVEDFEEVDLVIPGRSGDLVLHYDKEKGFAMIQSPCPDQVCVHTGYISKVGQHIICVPEGIIISIEGEGEEYDSLTN